MAPFQAPHKAPQAIPTTTPTQMGRIMLVTEVLPKPVSITQPAQAARDITEPTEISVPAETATTSVMPTARMAISLPRFRMSMIRPYRTPFLMPMEKNPGSLKTLISSTRIIQITGRKSGFFFSFLKVLIRFHLLQSRS